MPELNTITKTVIVTSALPYANGQIHLGHIASTYLPADIYTRYIRLSGLTVYHVCASDDFGTPILIRSEKEKKTPSDYVSYWNRRDLKDFQSLAINFDLFSRTSSPENKSLVQSIFNKLQSNGYIYEKEVIQPFCPVDKKFLPDRFVVGTCPNCGAEGQYSDLCENCGKVPEEILDPKCWICGSVPIKRSSNHYFFQLSKFSDKLRDWLIKNSNLQEDIKKYVLNWINNGLVDWDITRDIEWGIPIPTSDANGKVFYGWFDNHICYISSLLILAEEHKKDGKQLWNESAIFHFIGKDIVYHHYLFLPAIRLGIDQEYKLPDYLPTRGHLLLKNKKLSKSRNWYISIEDFTQRFETDYLRFYLASITPYSQDDVNFDWDTFREKINNELIANVGNFINRTLTLIQNNFASSVPKISKLESYDNEAIDRIHTIGTEVGTKIESNHLNRALMDILAFSSFLNSYFQHKKPWSSSSVDTTLYISVNAVRTLAIVLAPFIPNSSEKIWYQLKLGDSVHKQEWSSSGVLRIAPGHVIGKIVPLFKKIDKETIEKLQIEMTGK
ncbi:MAG TPA: methionine--tRNA ligase [Nitrososphaeraceae archaeon]|jgi:methionyl-tRNA synthetase